MDEKILESLLKRAKGYNYNEVQEEYSVGEDGEPVLVKRKVLEKYCPPDSSALKTYLELNPEPSVGDMSDEELEQERQRLLAELKSLQEQNKNSEPSPSMPTAKSSQTKKGVKNVEE